MSGHRTIVIRDAEIEVEYRDSIRTLRVLAARLYKILSVAIPKREMGTSIGVPMYQHTSKEIKEDS